MTTNRIWLGLIAALSIAACSSKDPLLNGHGGVGNRGGVDGGAGVGGAVPCDGGSVIICTDGITKVCSLTDCPSTGGTGGGAGRGGTGGGTGGTAGAAGSGGTGGATGAGGTGGAAGAGGTGGAAGRGGTGGAAGTVGGAPGGRGGAGGTTGAAGSAGGTGGGVDGGTDARACETAQCLRPYMCIRACGGPVVTNNCCACEPPLFDDFNGMACGDGGTGAISYVGCRFIGGIDRIVVAKRDTSRNLCVNVVFANGTPPAGLTLPSGHGLESVSVLLPSECPTRTPSSAGGAGPVTGTATWTTSGNPTTADVDLLVTLPGNDEALIARNVDVTPACQ